MKHLIIILGCLILSSNSNAQDASECDLLPSVYTSSAINFHMKEITEEDYTSRRKKEKEQLILFRNSDSIEKVFQYKYPKIFNKKDDGYVFKGFNDKDVFVRNNLKKDKSHSKYQFKAQYKNYIIISEQFYEGGRSVLVDVNTNKSYTLDDKPHFITDTLIYSVVFDYGNTILSILDVEKKEQISLEFKNILPEEFYNLSNHIRLKLKCMKSGEVRYLEVLK